ncbi:hypothetical protein SAMN04487988_107190 [Algoriphagus hitonicola]|uniref:6-bladed beta-propeller protein n=2 Tax=Algoriphagus hitonicola TaxID=435880 RepID=A0A1I2UDT0_9BACT|nr:hypothetical protein SAMN04487988_107190 [Algoriphagus hitonicola]
MNFSYQREVIPNLEFSELTLDKTESVGVYINFETPLILPIPVFSRDSSVVIFDFGDRKIKQFFEGGERTIDPLGDGPNKIQGQIIEGVGLSSNHDELFIASNSTIRKFDFKTNSFNEEIEDSFENCDSFDAMFYEIFYKVSGKDSVIISQNGNPCFPLKELGNSFDPNDLSQKNFVRIKSINNKNYDYSLKFPSNLSLDKAYERFKFHFTYNEVNDRYYVMFNPLKYLYEYKFNFSKSKFILTNLFDLDLPRSNQEIEYIIKNNFGSSEISKALDYNFELQFIKSSENYVFILYQPSKDIIYDDPNEAPFSSHYFISIMDLSTEELKTYSIDYNEFQFLGALQDQVWLYDILNSNESGKTQIKVVSVDELTSIK